MIRNRINPYDTTAMLTHGIHFFNGVRNEMTHDFTAENLFSSPLIGVHGSGTVFHFKGFYSGDGGQAKGGLVLQDSGRFVVDDSSTIDLIMSGNMYTRQIWMWGDGTGIFEIEEGYIADKTNNGNLGLGTGSLRIYDIILLTHHTRSLPVYMRGDNINSHLVIDGGKKTKWIITTNNQILNGGLWLESGDLTLET